MWKGTTNAKPGKAGKAQGRGLRPGIILESSMDTRRLKISQIGLIPSARREKVKRKKIPRIVSKMESQVRGTAVKCRCARKKFKQLIRRPVFRFLS